MNVDVVRAKVAARFAKTLGDDSLGKKLEIVLWNHVLRTCQADHVPLEWGPSFAASFRERYTAKAIALDVYNLQKFDALRQQVVSGTVPLKKVVAMKPWELAPELWEPVFERVAFKQLRKQLTVDVDSAPEGMLQCRKCKSKKTTFIEMQTRSADEPMTVFATCLACGNRWKQ